MLPAHWRCRPGTWDELVFHEVVHHNAYGLPSQFDSADVVIDVGAHCGAFAWACVARGAALVQAYEVASDNYETLVANLSPIASRVRARHSAVWRSDTSEVVRFQPPRRSYNTGEGRVNPRVGEIVSSVSSLDDAVAEALDGGGSEVVRLLKLDVEGGEFPILYTTRTLDRVTEIIGEYHEGAHGLDPMDDLPPHTMSDLACHLTSMGFSVISEERRPGIGMFRARRHPVPCEPCAGDPPTAYRSSIGPSVSDWPVPAHKPD